MLLDCTLEVSFLRVLGGVVVSVMLGSGFVSILFKGRRVYFSQDYMCRVLKNFSDCSICSVSERLRRYFTTMKLCTESAKGRCDFSNLFSKCRRVSVFSLWIFEALGGVKSAGRRGVRLEWGNRIG